MASNKGSKLGVEYFVAHKQGVECKLLSWLMAIARFVSIGGGNGLWLF